MEAVEGAGGLFADFINMAAKNPSFLPIVVIFETIIVSLIASSQRSISLQNAVLDIIQLPILFLFSEFIPASFSGLDIFHILVFLILGTLWVLLFILGDFVNLAVEHSVLFLGLIAVETLILAVIHIFVNRLPVTDTILNFFTLPFAIFSSISYASITILERVHVVIFLAMLLLWLFALIYSLMNNSGSEYRKNLGIKD